MKVRLYYFIYTENNSPFPGYKFMTEDSLEHLYGSAVLHISTDETIASNIATEFVKNLNFGSNGFGHLMITKE